MTLSWRESARCPEGVPRIRRNRSVIVTMAISRSIFPIQPVIVVDRLSASASADLGQMHLLVYMLAIPVFTPAMLAAYAVAGERTQGSLEPILTTPIRREEFLLGKALAVLAVDRRGLSGLRGIPCLDAVRHPAGDRVVNPQAARHRGAVPLHAAACLPLRVGRDRFSTRSTTSASPNS